MLPDNQMQNAHSSSLAAAAIAFANRQAVTSHARHLTAPGRHVSASSEAPSQTLAASTVNHTLAPVAADTSPAVPGSSMDDGTTYQVPQQQQTTSTEPPGGLTQQGPTSQTTTAPGGTSQPCPPGTEPASMPPTAAAASGAPTEAATAENQAHFSAPGTSRSSSPYPAAGASPPGSAAACSSFHSYSPCGSSPCHSTPGTGDIKGTWTPLSDYLVHLLMTVAGAPSREEAEACLSADLLLQLPNIYTYVNDLLRGIRVRTSLAEGILRDQKHGVSYFGIEKPADILHEDPHSPGGPGISCAEYNKQMGHILQHPDWPCINILVNKLVEQHGAGPRAYKSFPLECCWVLLSGSQPAKKLAGDEEWSWCDLPGPSGAPEGELIRGRLPSWVAEKFWRHKAESVPAAPDCEPPAVAATAAPAAAAAAAAPSFSFPSSSAPPAAATQCEASFAVGQGNPGEVAGSSSGVAQQHISAHAYAAQPTIVTSKHSSSTAVLLDSLPGSVQQSVPAVTVAAAPTQVPDPTPPTAAAAAGAAQQGQSAQDGTAADVLSFLPSRSSYDSDTTSSSSDQPADDFPSCSSADSPAAAAHAAAAAASRSMCFGMDSWVKKSLHPHKDEKRRMKAVLDVVQQALASKAVSEVWSVVAMHPVGSFSRSTFLRSSHDLDLLIELKTNDNQRGDFQKCRDECFNAIATALIGAGCTNSTASVPASDAAAAAAGAAAATSSAAGGPAGLGLAAMLQPTDLHTVAMSGWDIAKYGSKGPYWLRLKHPVLDLQLDVHVCQSPQLFDKSPTYTSVQGRHNLLQHLIDRAEHAAGHTTVQPPDLGPIADSLSSPTECNGNRTALLTPMMAEVIKGVPKHCIEQYGYQPDSLVTDVVRAVKAWAKFGLPHVLDSGNCCSSCCGTARGGSSSSGGRGGSTSGDGRDSSGGGSSSPAAAGVPSMTGGQKQHSCSCHSMLLADYNKLPPSYIWEVVVIYVLLQKLDAAMAEGQRPSDLYPSHSRTLLLFMHVMEAASRLLHPESTEVIALYMRFTREQCELFRGLWGPPGPLYSPRIINPVDPSFNCTKHSGFTGWAAVAAAAGQLHEQMQQLLQGGVMVADGAAAVQQDAGGGRADTKSAWEQLVEGSSLRHAVAAFRG